MTAAPDRAAADRGSLLADGFRFEQERSVDAALTGFAQAEGRSRVPVGSAWRLRLGAGRGALELDARLEEGWLLLVAVPRARTAGPPSARALLETNARLAGGVRFALAPDSPAYPLLQLRAEIPLGGAWSSVSSSKTDLAERLEQAATGFIAGFAAWTRRVRTTGRGLSPARSSEEAAGVPVVSEVPEIWRERLRLAIAGAGEAGWRCAERADGFVVDLEVGEAFEQARVGHGADAALRVGAELPRPETRVCEDAVATLLLRTGGAVRTVRGVWGKQPGLEVPLGPSAPSSDLAPALEALSVALRLVGEEGATLARDTEVGRAYTRSVDQHKEK